MKTYLSSISDLSVIAMGSNMKDVLKQILKEPKTALRRYYLMEQRASLFDEIFMRQDYYWLVKNAKPGTTVLDLGANLGDTAVYFAMFDKIKKVIAYEPVPMAYKLAKNFIKQNPFRRKILFYNKAVDSKKGKKRISESRPVDFGFSYGSSKDKSGVYVESITLNDALKGLKNVVIKCDIEGAESTIFNNTDLSRVNAIELEYHDNLKAVLDGLNDKGFKIIVSGTSKKQGMLYAIRS